MRALPRCRLPRRRPLGYERAMTPEQYPVHAPEFREGLDWIGTDRPLRLADLRGKLVLLDFWTYG